MANPNTVVAAFRDRKYVCVGEFIFPKWSQAQDYADDMRKKNKYAMVRVTGVNMGRRRNPIRKFIVRVYETTL